MDNWLWIGLAVVTASGIGFWAFVHFYLGGESLTRYDALAGPWQPSRRSVSPENATVLTRVAGLLTGGDGPSKGKLRRLRATLDSLGDEADLAGITIVPTNAGGIAAEWVLADTHTPDRRLLYIHGGAWAMGSPKSHRVITTELARRSGAAVLAIDYRLIPEHPRLACFDDCQIAYRWLAAHGPGGASPATRLFIAGDSAGGNLTLAMSAWARDADVPTPDAVAALSPATDGTVSAPSIKRNLATDAMLGPLFAPLVRSPKTVVLLAFWLKTGLRPADPRVSPIHGNLAGLPPTLVQVSECEMLLDDARRYVAKARAAGTPAELQTWPQMVHVWHFFAPVLPEGRDALAKIAEFFEHHAPRA